MRQSTTSQLDAEPSLGSSARTGTLVWCIHIFFLLAFTALLAFAWMMYQSVIRAEHAEKRVDVAEGAIGHIESLRELFLAVESAQRGLLLTDNPVYLIEREARAAELQKTLLGLKQISIGGPRQTAVERLEELVANRMRIAREHYELRQQLGFQQPWPASATEAAILAGRRVRDLTEQMRHHELTVLASSEAQAAGHEEALKKAGVALVFIALLLAVPLLSPAQSHRDEVTQFCEAILEIGRIASPGGAMRKLGRRARDAWQAPRATPPVMRPAAFT